MCKTGTSASTRLPTEILQYIYSLLQTDDFNAARHTCQSWMTASLDRTLLVTMLKQAGWWSSILRILTPIGLARSPAVSEEYIMSKWISKECNFANPAGRAFVQVGYTDFRGIIHQPGVGNLHGEVAFTVSLCGRYLIAAIDQIAYVYELNHICTRSQHAWPIPLRRPQGMPLGFMRPVMSVICPRRILSCSMDTSSGRHSVAFLTEGRVGMVCDITADVRPKPALRSQREPGSDSMSSAWYLPTSASNPPGFSTTCVCLDRSPQQAPCVEAGERSVYRNICSPDDPPRSVAICPQRNCVAFGCTAGIELH